MGFTWPVGAEPTGRNGLIGANAPYQDETDHVARDGWLVDPVKTYHRTRRIASYSQWGPVTVG